jgi:acyl-CoA thioesterase
VTVGAFVRQAVVMTAEDYGQFPLRSHLGFDIDQSVPGEAVAVLGIAEHHLNPNGVVHGAVLFALVDTAMGAATMSTLDEGLACASIEAQIRFLAPVASGRLEARTRVIRAGRRVVQLECRVHLDEADDPVAVASGSFAVISMPAPG